MRLWTEDDGLPQNMATSIAQTPDGYLWLGTERGLVRFDGVSFRLHDPTNTPEMSNPWVTALAVGPGDSLWVGTAGGGLLLHERGRFTARTTSDGLPHDHVTALAPGRDGRIHVGTNGGGLVTLGPDGSVAERTAGRGLSSDVVLALAEDAAGRLWVGTPSGLDRIEPGGTTIRLGRADGLAADRVDVLLATREGTIWAGSSGAGLSRITADRVSRVTRSQGLSSNTVSALWEDPAGAVWVGTNGGGLNRITSDGIETLTAGGQLPGNLILGVSGDREGGLWLGVTGAGLVRLGDGLFQTLGRPEGLTADIALALLDDGAGGLWIGTAGGGLSHVRDGQVTTWTVADGLGSNVVIALARGPADELWIGTAGGGLSRLRNGRITTWGTEDGLLAPSIPDLATEPDGTLWLATPGGALRWRDGPVDRLGIEDGLPSEVVTALLRDDEGALWIGTADGLARLRNGRVRSVALAGRGLPGNEVTELHLGPTGDLWVPTNRGLGRVRPAGPSASVGSDDDLAGRTRFHGPDRLPFGSQLHAAVEDTLGFLWITSNEGIGRVRIADLDRVERGELDQAPVRTFGRADGLRSAEANGGVGPAGIRHADGSLWFPTMRGAARVLPTPTIPVRRPPAPILESVVTGDVLRPAREALDLPPEHRTVEFRFTAPTFVAPDEVRFRYRLEGFDAGWIEAGERRVAFYTNLPPGSYHFRVESGRENGSWSEEQAVMALTVAPHPWETVGFRFAALLTVVVAAGGAYRARVRTLRRRELRLLRLTAEQERTGRELRQIQERLRLALEAGRMGTWEWDVGTGVVNLPDATVELLAFHPRTIEELLSGLADRLPGERRHEVAGLAQDVLAGEESIHVPFSVGGGAGPEAVPARHLELRGRAFREEGGEIVRVMGVVADVTELMTAQAELERREEELRHAQKMEAVGRLAGGVAHDFNNLLTTILGRTDLLLETFRARPEQRSEAGDEELEDLEEIQRSAERAANLTQQLLTFSRKQILRPELLDLNEVVEGVERMLRRRLREDVVLEKRLAPDLVGVRADAGGIEQILVNLIVNAQDAMPDGGRLRIETSNAPREQDAGPAHHAVLTVSDTGEGMDAQTLEQAFDPFFTTKPVGKGTGLGLATVYGIVQQCRGEVRVESRPGEGTTFRIFLPRAAG